MVANTTCVHFTVNSIKRNKNALMYLTHKSVHNVYIFQSRKSVLGGPGFQHYILDWCEVRHPGNKGLWLHFQAHVLCSYFKKEEKNGLFFYKRSFIYLFIYIIIVIYAFNLNYFVSFCGFYVFYVSFLNVNSSIGMHFRSTFVVFLFYVPFK